MLKKVSAMSLFCAGDTPNLIEYIYFIFKLRQENSQLRLLHVFTMCLQC